MVLSAFPCSWLHSIRIPELLATTTLGSAGSRPIKMSRADTNPAGGPCVSTATPAARSILASPVVVRRLSQRFRCGRCDATGLAQANQRPPVRARTRCSDALESGCSSVPSRGAPSLANASCAARPCAPKRPLRRRRPRKTRPRGGPHSRAGRRKDCPARHGLAPCSQYRLGEFLLPPWQRREDARECEHGIPSVRRPTIA